MYVNASLLRELRMIYQHATTLFGGRTPAASFGAPQQTGLVCTFCYLKKRRNRKPAIVMINGQGVCDEHAHFAKNEHILSLLRVAEKHAQS
jgi:hypothetical protein